MSRVAIAVINHKMCATTSTTIDNDTGDCDAVSDDNIMPENTYTKTHGNNKHNL